MSIPPKVLANGLFRRGGASVPDAAVASELFAWTELTEHQRKVQRENSYRWEGQGCICCICSRHPVGPGKLRRARDSESVLRKRFLFLRAPVVHTVHID